MQHNIRPDVGTLVFVAVTIRAVSDGALQVLTHRIALDNLTKQFDLQIAYALWQP